MLYVQTKPIMEKNCSYGYLISALAAVRGLSQKEDDSSSLRDG